MNADLQALAEAGSLAIAAQENLRLARNKNRAQVQRRSHKPQRYNSYDAEAGTVIMTGPAGGVAPVAVQGTLTNRAIAQGEAIRTFSTFTADTKPTNF